MRKLQHLYHKLKFKSYFSSNLRYDERKIEYLLQTSADETGIIFVT